MVVLTVCAVSLLLGCAVLGVLLRRARLALRSADEAAGAAFDAVGAASARVASDARDLAGPVGRTERELSDL
ncbi:hypothetical protein BIV57_05760 [Mangrovactinospora gilvigrisea]|uniref:Uncharacterized protein n=1 Tax=Mangrovactinospora gilvigrisea TaxID=1428644 RepID=A0A1J7CA47_9ACTN|nr:hypothetical protein [Mangrovactinospora gilvigrisea]OIV38400.1 hypothetical protein BIV57_05760 [Mangrovactinospora gilvigrisea]